MRRIALIVVVLLTLGVSSAFAQTGNGTAPGQADGSGGAGQEGSISGPAMMDDMSKIAGQMSDIMGQIPGLLRDMPQEQSKKMSKLMKNMSHEMMMMAKMIESGSASQNDMDKLQRRMRGMQKMLSRVRR